MLTRPKPWLDLLTTLETSGRDLTRSFTADLAEKMPGDVGMSGAQGIGAGRPGAASVNMGVKKDPARMEV